MSNVIELFTTSGPRVIVESCIVSKTVTESERGIELVEHPPGHRRYFVSVIDPELGGEVILWDGPSYEGAMVAARDCSDGWDNAPIINRVRA